MNQDKTTGTFYTSDNKAVCRGFYGTQTHKVTSCDLTPPTNLCWAVTEAKNGTGLRLFSISQTELSETNAEITKYNGQPDYRGFVINNKELEPWRQSNDRAWFLATFKNLEGHLGRWKDGGNKTFGQMFEEILGEQGIANVLEATKDNLCISYFMRHKDNDIHNEMTDDEESHVIQTVVWDISNQEFVGPSMPNWPTPQEPVREPTVLYKNDTLDNEPFEGLYFKEGETVKIEDGHPLLLTVYRGGEIDSFKLITHADEYVRQFRSRSHSRFVALMVCEQLAKTGKAEHIEELQIAKARLFTPDELEGYKANVQAGRDEFFEELDRKYDGGYVAFHKKIYNTCKIGDCLKEFRTVNKLEDPDQYEKNRQALKDKLWNQLVNCTKWRNVGALEAFWEVYVRASLN